MASSSFSHSPSRSPSSNQVLICYCGEPSPLRTSNIPSSMGRRFYGCGRYPLVIAEETSCCRPLIA
ncbi:hypothetical protein RHMOL_Rhmol02G0201200 [Rhododendron molle]|uniref:Uncharacterized protein n=1 Tax=Rhododendron molle TaxID=49168 RepID=A0ACC0PTI8_RHOML|nr:hypothetical protein RHMOL_Rhmol02G0201200 [Rhododendron molle]